MYTIYFELSQFESMFLYSHAKFEMKYHLFLLDKLRMSLNVIYLTYRTRIKFYNILRLIIISLSRLVSAVFCSDKCFILAKTLLIRRVTSKLQLIWKKSDVILMLYLMFIRDMIAFAKQLYSLPVIWVDVKDSVLYEYRFMQCHKSTKRSYTWAKLLRKLRHHCI